MQTVSIQLLCSHMDAYFIFFSIHSYQEPAECKVTALVTLVATQPLLSRSSCLPRGSHAHKCSIIWKAANDKDSDMGDRKSWMEEVESVSSSEEQAELCPEG